jgi:hypothetical protein
MHDMNDILRGAVARKRTRAARLLGLGPAEPPPGDPLRPDPPEPAPPDPDPEPRPAGRVPAGPRQPPPQPGGDFLAQLMLRSRRHH